MESDPFPYHVIRLKTERLILRPFLQTDYDIALPFYQDPDFVDLMEGDPPAIIDRSYIEGAGESMARQGFFFAVEEKTSGEAVGEVCLQWMNLDRADVKEGEKVTRLPIGIWDKRRWGKGYGKEIVQRLMAYAFEDLEVDRFCAMDVKITNVRSQGLWESCGLKPVREVDGHVDYEIDRSSYGEEMGDGNR